MFDPAPRRTDLACPDNRQISWAGSGSAGHGRNCHSRIFAGAGGYPDGYGRRSGRRAAAARGSRWTIRTFLNLPLTRSGAPGRKRSGVPGLVIAELVRFCVYEGFDNPVELLGLLHEVKSEALKFLCPVIELYQFFGPFGNTSMARVCNARSSFRISGGRATP